jgi:hypothetical protein
MGNTVGKVESGLAVVVIVVSILGIIGAVAAFIGSGKLYEQVGKGDFALDRDSTSAGPKPGSSARREARGEPALDIDAELAALSRPQGVDAGLRDEVRQLVIARNERRIRRGEEPLDVEAEVERQLRDAGA